MTITSTLIDARSFDTHAPELIAKIAQAKLVGFDLETHDAGRHEGLNQFMKVNADGEKAGNRPLVFDVRRTVVCGFSLFVDGDDQAYYVNLNHADRENRVPWAKAKTLLDALPAGACFVCHNAVFERTMMRNSLGYELPTTICTMQLAVSAYSPDEYEPADFQSLDISPIMGIVEQAVRNFTTYDPKGGLTGPQGELFAQFCGKESDAAHSYNGWVKTISRPYDLKRCIEYWFGAKMQTFKETLGDDHHMGQKTGAEVVGYGADDAYWAVRLYHRLVQHMAVHNKAAIPAYFKQELPCVDYYSDVWSKGLRIDRQAVEDRRILERGHYAAILRRMKAAIRTLLPFPGELHAGLMKFDSRWYENGAARYRMQLVNWARTPDKHDDFNETQLVRGAVSISWAAELGKPEPKTLSIGHYMPARTMLYDLMQQPCFIEKGKVQSDGECRGKMKDRLEAALRGQLVDVYETCTEEYTRTTPQYTTEETTYEHTEQVKTLVQVPYNEWVTHSKPTESASKVYEALCELSNHEKVLLGSFANPLAQRAYEVLKDRTLQKAREGKLSDGVGLDATGKSRVVKALREGPEIVLDLMVDHHKPQKLAIVEFLKKTGHEVTNRAICEVLLGLSEREIPEKYTGVYYALLDEQIRGGTHDGLGMGRYDVGLTELMMWKYKVQIEAMGVDFEALRSDRVTTWQEKVLRYKTETRVTPIVSTKVSTSVVKLPDKVETLTREVTKRGSPRLELPSEAQQSRLQASLDLLACMGELAGNEQRAKLYLNPYTQLIDPETERVYPIISSKLASRRTSIQHPNGQQLAKRGDSTYIRGFYLPDHDDHVILSSDWSSIELVLIGELSQDPEFKKAFGQLPYQDLHLGATASCLNVVWDFVDEEYLKNLKSMPIGDIDPRILTNIKGEAMDPDRALKYWRTEVGKAANFGYWYSGALSDVGRRLGWTSDQMWAAVEAYRARFAVAEQWRINTIEGGKANGFIQLPDGHRRSRYECTEHWRQAFMSKFGIFDNSPGVFNFFNAAAKKIQTRANNQCVNSLIQGSCATMMKRSILRMKEAISSKGWTDREARLLIPIHDEILVSVHKDLVVEAIELVRVAMCHPDIVTTLPLTVAPAIGRTFEPFIKGNRKTQIELAELSKVPCVAEDRWDKPANDDEVRAVVDWIFERTAA